MSDGRGDIGLALLIGIVIGGIMGFGLGMKVEMESRKADAVRAGHAEWVSDESGGARWQWKEAGR